MAKGLFAVKPAMAGISRGCWIRGFTRKLWRQIHGLMGQVEVVEAVKPSGA